MSDEVRVTAASGGQKGSKPVQPYWVDPYGLEEVGRVAGYGAEKYGDPWNYRKGYPQSLSMNAAERHILKDKQGEEIDPESGCYHLAHAAWNLMTALGQRLRARQGLIPAEYDDHFTPHDPQG